MYSMDCNDIQNAITYGKTSELMEAIKFKNQVRKCSLLFQKIDHHAKCLGVSINDFTNIFKDVYCFGSATQIVVHKFILTKARAFFGEPTCFY